MDYGCRNRFVTEATTGNHFIGNWSRHYFLTGITTAITLADGTADKAVARFVDQFFCLMQFPF